LLDLGAPSVLSTPLAVSARTEWEAAGFTEAITLSLLRLSLDGEQPGPDHLVHRGDETPIGTLLGIDEAAFEGFWRFDAAALNEAKSATAKSDVFVINDGAQGAAGYAIVGYGHAISYLQRVAVHPDWQGQGMGRSLIRTVARSAKRAGSKALLLNTQSENEPAISLYASEGYVLLPETLAVLRAT
jgi:ribosomal protein S18 acetylase RimI-like enzyme